MKKRSRDPVETKEDLVNRIRQRRSELQALGIASIALFGSFARGTQKRRSDVDLLVNFTAGEKSFDHFMEASFLLERIMSRKVRLITGDSLTPAFKARIEKDLIDVSLTE